MYQICVLQGTTAYSYLTTPSLYPGIRLKVNHSLSSNQGDRLLQAVVDGSCSGAVLNLIDWEFYQTNQNVNSKCNLVQVETVQTYAGAFPYLVDFSRRCTSFVETVLSTILIGMRSDGVLDEIIQNNLLVEQDIFCEEQKNPSDVLGVVNMSGVLMIYAVACGLGIICYFVEIGREKIIERRSPPINPEHEKEKEVKEVAGTKEKQLESGATGTWATPGTKGGGGAPDHQIQVEDINHIC